MHAAEASGTIALLTMADIRRLCRDHVPPEQIVDKAAEQGIDFAVTPAIEGELQALGFRPPQIAAVKGSPDQPLIPGKGMWTSEAQRERMLQEIKTINALSGLELLSVHSRHLTLWTGKGIVEESLPTVEKLEAFFHTKFREPVRCGLDRRSAHLIYLKTRVDYARWIKAMLDLIGSRYEEKDNPGGNEEFRASVAKGPAFYTPWFSAICLEGNEFESEHRCTGLAVGYMYYSQLARPRKAGPLATGFANLAEEVAAGSPKVMIANSGYHQDRRDLGADSRPWSLLVRRQFLKKQLTPLDKFFKLDTFKMVQSNYVEAWSLTTLLARQPDLYGKMLLAIRAGTPELKAIEDAYGWDGTRLGEEWRKHALRQK